MVRDRIITEISRVTGLDTGVVDDALEIPPDVEMGDYAFPCFVYAKQEKENPAKLAAHLAQEIEGFYEVEQKGPYVNIKCHPEDMLRAAQNPSFKNGSDTILIEFPSPNTNKPLHLGHALNMAIGQSTTNILRRLGHTVITENLFNDRGIHICKSMYAYRELGKNTTPEEEGAKPDHFVGEYYAAYNDLVENNEDVEEENQALLAAWERGDQDVVQLWETLRSWCLRGIRETLNDYGVETTKERFESTFYKEGKRIIQRGLETGVFEEGEDGSIVADLEEQSLGTKHVLREDGTSIYITQDIALAHKRSVEYDLDRIVYVVGNEQQYHFNCLFEILKRLGYDFSDQLHHLSYGMLELSTGKMSSREGNVVTADEVRQNVINLAAKEIEERHSDLEPEALRRRAQRIGMGALKFYLLHNDVRKDMVYDAEKSVSFTGQTGPYIQYTYARISSLLKENSERGTGETLTDEHERNVLRLLAQYADHVERAGEQYAPNIVANYAYRLAQTFTGFYHECKVLDDDVEVQRDRLALCQATRDVLRDAMKLLGIPVMEEM